MLKINDENDDTLDRDVGNISGTNNDYLTGGRSKGFSINNTP